MRRIISLFAAAAALSFAAPTAAATLVVDGDGHLTAVTGLDVNGTLYDVSIKDGTCIDLFAGCTDNSAFFFSEASAINASDALRIAVDSNSAFDTNPSLIRGCGALDACYILVPFDVSFNQNVQGNIVSAQAFLNYTPSISVDYNSNATLAIDTDTGKIESFTYAVFTPTAVPEPATWAMMLLGFGAIGATLRRRRQTGSVVSHFG